MIEYVIRVAKWVSGVLASKKWRRRRLASRSAPPPFRACPDSAPARRAAAPLPGGAGAQAAWRGEGSPGVIPCAGENCPLCALFHEEAVPSLDARREPGRPLQVGDRCFHRGTRSFVVVDLVNHFLGEDRYGVTHLTGPMSGSSMTALGRDLEFSYPGPPTPPFHGAGRRAARGGGA